MLDSGLSTLLFVAVTVQSGGLLSSSDNSRVVSGSLHVRSGAQLLPSGGLLARFVARRLASGGPRHPRVGPHAFSGGVMVSCGGLCVRSNSFLHTIVRPFVHSAWMPLRFGAETRCSNRPRECSVATTRRSDGSDRHSVVSSLRSNGSHRRSNSSYPGSVRPMLGSVRPHFRSGGSYPCSVALHASTNACSLAINSDAMPVIARLARPMHLGAATRRRSGNALGISSQLTERRPTTARPMCEGRVVWID